MSNGHNDNPVGFNLVDDPKWVAPKQVLSCSVIERSPRLWLFRDRDFCGIEFGVEAGRGRRASLGVPSGTRLGFF